ncbi:hypothetical protein AXF42_Ash003876 [Apostasia shenzhenica]|uniref:Uncharacterized protein n=1 Tax=Apostasia shenzhenica TaxID=1088818 RepID=A0A2I0AI54_9ASPA|nr:hypothetical protein AXF42_Ash003876 [Apostasia shenzhenica]
MKESLLRAPKSGIPERRKKQQLPLLGSTPQRNHKELGAPFSPSSPVSGITDALSSTSAAAGDLEEVSSNHSDLPDFTPLPSADLLSYDSEIAKELILSNSLDSSDRLQKSPALILSRHAGEAGDSAEKSPTPLLIEIAGEAGSYSTEKSPVQQLGELAGEASRSAESRTASSESGDQAAALIVEAEMAMLGFSKAVTKLADAMGGLRRGGTSDMRRAAETTLAFLAGMVLVVLLITMAAPSGPEIWNGSSEFFGANPT